MANSAPNEPHLPPRPGGAVVGCAVCGAPLGSGLLEEQCARCLLGLAAASALDSSLIGPDFLDEGQVRSFGDYELLEEVARGGMGVVYRAWQRSLNREVAVKMILAGELAGQTARQLFENEAQAAATLHHPNIIPVYETGEHEMQPYFTMRYVAGGRTIAHWVADRRGRHREIAAEVAKVARAVAHAHERGVLHRDLKPSNVLWDEQAGPQVTDFGLAKLLEAKDAVVTGSVLMAGSPSYMAPEQVEGGEITTVTDVHGMGALLYELLQGRPPYLGRTVVETARQVVEESPPPLTGVARELQTICLKCLAKRPMDRYRSAEALAKDLECFARGEPVSTVPLAPAQRLLNWARRKPKQAVLLGVTLLSLIGGLGGVVWQWRTAEQASAGQRRALEHLRWQGIGRWLKEGQTAKALSYLAAQIRMHPERWQPVMYAMSIVDQHVFPRLAGPTIEVSEKLAIPAEISPDGRWVAGAGNDQRLRVWQVDKGQQVASWECGSAITALATGDGRFRVAVGHADGRVSLFANWETPAVQLALTASGPIKGVVMAASAQRLLVWREDSAEIWPLETLEAGPVVVRVKPGVKGARLSADGRRLMMWHQRHAQVWDLGEGGAVLRLEVAAEERFKAVSLSLNGARLAVLDGDFMVRTWEVETALEGAPIESALTALTLLSLDAEGRFVTTAGHRHDMSVHEVKSGLRVSGAMNHHYILDVLTTSRNGEVMASIGGDHVTRLWDARTGVALCSPVQMGLGGLPLLSPSLSHAGEAVLIHVRGLEVDTLAVWNMTHTRSPLQHGVEGCRDFNSASITEDGGLAALGLFPVNRCRVIEPETGRVVLDRQANGHVYVTLFSPDRRQCYALTANGWVHGWDMETGAELWPPNQQPGKIRPGMLSPDGSRIIAGHNDGHIRIYDVATGQVAMTLAHAGEVKSLRFAPDGSARFLSTSTDRLAHIWDLNSGRKLRTFAGHEGTIIASGWSPDARLIVTASYDGTARQWEARTGRPVGEPMHHQVWLSHVEFSPDGKLVATACRDGTARLWQVGSGLPASEVLTQGQSCETVRFTSDGAAFVLRDLDGFQFWDTQNAEPVSVHYAAVASGGLGMDSVTWRALMTADGSRVFHGYSMNQGSLWHIEQPRGPAPGWFPDFLESLALLRMEDSSRHGPELALKLLELRQTVLIAGSADPFVNWARRVIGSDRGAE